MKSRGLILFLLLLAFFTGPRLPAPIVEEPTPRPKTVATPKPKPKENVPTRHTASTPKPVRSPFAGTWGGVAQYQGSDGTVETSPYTIRVREDGKAIWVTSKTSDGEPWTSELASHMEGATLVATGEAHDKTFSVTFRFALNQNGTMALFRLTRFTSGDTGTHTATLIRQ